MFDSRSEFSFTERSARKNVIILGADMSSSVHIDNENKDILILGEGLAQGLDATTLAAEAKYSINFTQSGNRFEIKYYRLCLGNISIDFTINNMKETDLKGAVKVLSVDYNAINTNDTLDIHRYFMKKT